MADRIAGIAGEALQVIGVPKTIDNDLMETDHTPGYASAARFFACAVRDIGEDNRSLPGPWHTSYPLIGSETENVKRIGADNYRDPIKVFFPNSNAFLKTLFGNMQRDGWADWPAEAPSSIDVYTSDAIPGWKNSLLIPTLKGSQLIRLQLNAAGDKIAGDTIDYFTGIGRVRDIAISPDGLKLYLSVDNTPGSSEPSRHFPGHGNFRGCILEFSYLGRGGQ